MSVLDEINKLKAARRAEIAAAEEERRQAEEERRQAEEAAKALFFQRLNAALERILGEKGLSYLLPLARNAVQTWDGDTRAGITFDIPGHRPILLRLRAVTTDWRLADRASEGVLPWCVLDESGGQHASFHHFTDAIIAAEIPGWTPPAEPPVDRQLSDEELHAARLAWAAMLQEVEPMPAAIALDNVQDVTGERDDAVSALHHAAAEWLDSLRPEQARPDLPGHIYSDSFNNTLAIRAYLITEEYNLADNCRLEIHNTNSQIKHDFETEQYEMDEHGDMHLRVSIGQFDTANRWIAWCKHAVQAIDLCRAIASAAHPEPASAT